MVKILINDSGMYGLWMINALINSNIKFKVEFLSDDKILDLKNTKALFVPGGWAENKIENISEKSKETLRKFIENGGIYFGICGGARLASKGFLDLINIQKDSENLKNYSGPVMVNFSMHDLTKDLNEKQFIWFPPKFKIIDDKVKVLATLKSVCSEAFVYGIPVRLTSKIAQKNETYKNLFDTNLLVGSPVLMLEKLDFGEILVSTIHFDTPTVDGSRFFHNLKYYFNLEEFICPKFINEVYLKPVCENEIYKILFQNYKRVSQIINLAKRCMLIKKRYHFYYSWQSGFRGSEYQTLYFILRELVKLHGAISFPKAVVNEILYILLDGYLEKIKELTEYMEERIIYFKLDKIDEIFEKESLYFGHPKGVHGKYGGLYRKVLNCLEKIICISYNCILEER